MTPEETTELKKVLLVEDNPANRLVFQDLLESAGYEVESVEKAEDAITLVRETTPDLILMDLELPGMDGLTATRILREDKLTRTVSIVALTSHAMPGDRERALLAGCNGYLTKPINVAAFRDEISKILDRKT
ncbi:MAG: response regulator [Planctomycetota bacterium]|nr:response regulator [Planctomycetota bacterium]